MARPVLFRLLLTFVAAAVAVPREPAVPGESLDVSAIVPPLADPPPGEPWVAEVEPEEDADGFEAGERALLVVSEAFAASPPLASRQCGLGADAPPVPGRFHVLVRPPRGPPSLGG